MLANKTLLTASNLNSAYISQTNTSPQSINSTLTISGGALTLKNSTITDNASSSYLRIDPQGNNVIIYDGISNQRLDVFSSSGSESTYITTVNGTKSIGMIDISSAIDHLEINTNSQKPINIGGAVSILSGNNLTIVGNSSNDAGDIIFQQNNGTEIARVYSNGTNTLILSTGVSTDAQISITDSSTTINNATTINGLVTATGGVNIKSSQPLSFIDYGGGFNMTDATWIRTTGSKSFYHNAGEFRTDGILEVGSSGATLKVTNGGQFNYNSGKLTIDTNGTVNGVGPIILNTSKAQGSGIKIDGMTIDTVGSGGNIVLGGMNQFRFGTSTSWDYNQWAGIKYDSTGHVLWIGGPSSTQFSSNASPSQIQTIFDGLSGMGVNMTPRSGVTLDVNGDVGIASGHSLWVGNNADSGARTRIHNNGTDAYIDYGSGNLYIRKVDTAKVITLTNSGLVGIGGNTPLRTLDVSGDIRFSGNIYGGSGSLSLLTDAGGALSTKVGSLVISSSYSNNAPTNGLYVQGNTGIGTASPLGKIHIVDSAQEIYTGGDHLYLKYTSAGHYPYIGFIDSGGVRGGYIGYGVPGSYIGLYLENGNDLYIGGGNVGIGTTTPSQSLDVVGNTQTSSTFISNSTSYDIFQAMGASGTKTFRWEGGNLRFYTSQNSVLEAMTLSSVGNIGINQSNPAYKLDVNGNMNVTGLLYSLGDNQANFQIGNDSQLWDINVSNTVGIYGVQNSAVGALKLGSTGPTLYGTGNSLGLGTTTPSSLYILDTKGDIRIGSGNAIFSGYNNAYFIKDHANGNVTLSALGSHLYLGYQNTTSVYLSSALQTTSNVNIIGTDGTLYYKGTDTNSTYLRLDGTNTMTADLNIGSHNITNVSNINASTLGTVTQINGAYGKIAQSTDEWLRLNDDGSHTSGVYFGPSIVRTDGYFQIGNNGASGQWDGTGMTFPLGTLIQATGKDSANNTITKPIIEIQTTTDTGNTGYGLVIGGGGQTVIGAGESAQTVASGNLYSGNSERMWIASDNEIHILSNQQSGFDQSREIIIQNSDITVGDGNGNINYVNQYYRTPSAHTITTSGWYRIAQTNATSNSRAYGRFMVMDMSASNHELIDFTAGVAFNKPESVNIHMLGRVKYGSQEILGAVRIITGTTYQASYLEVFCNSGCVVQQIGEYYDQFWSNGWTPLDFVYEASVPTGYTANKMELQDGYYRNQNVFTGTTAPPSQGAYAGDIYVQY